MKALNTVFLILTLNLALISGGVLYKDRLQTNTPVVTESTTQIPTVVPTTIAAQPTQVTKPTTKPVVSGCIVTIQGKKYNVTQLRRTHSGGNIFVCGSDMTNTFFSMHNTRLLNNQMSKYLL